MRAPSYASLELTHPYTHIAACVDDYSLTAWGIARCERGDWFYATHFLLGALPALIDTAAVAANEVP